MFDLTISNLFNL